MQSQSQTTFSRFLTYLKNYKLPFLAAIVGMIGYSTIDALVLSQLQPLIDKGFTAEGKEFLLLASIFIVPIFLLRGVFNFMGAFTLSWIGTHVVMRIRQQLFSRYVHLPVSFHDRQEAGKLIAKITYDTELVTNAAGNAFLTLIREGALVIGLLAVMFYYSWQLSLIFLLIGPVVAAIVSVVSKRFRQVSKKIQQAMGNITSSVEQLLKGHKVVLMFGGQSKEIERFHQINNDNRQQNMKLISARILSVASIQVIASVSLAVVLYVAAMPDLLQGITAGTFTTVLTCMTMLLKPLKQLTTVNAEFQRGMTACTSAFEILDMKAEEDNGELRFDKVKGELAFDGVTFCYPGKQTASLQNVEFKLPAGKTLALVGRSGSGKSTIASLLTRFYNVEKGAVLVDGRNIKDYQLTSLREQFALVSQNVILFNDTIANNICYGCENEVTREQIEQAADLAHVTEFSSKLSGGLDTEIGENGLALSGGQRQRIAIARALLRNAPILILDEATSALDTESERLIQQALDRLQQNRTSIVIAHRLSTIENADNILVIDAGKIVEQGNHQQLLDKQGLYSQLHQLQQGMV